MSTATPSAADPLAPVSAVAPPVGKPAAGDSPAAAAPPPNEPDVSVAVDELITGRKLKFPIHDENGVLLLAEGMPVTADVKRSLKSRGFQNVNLKKSDAANATLKLNVNLRSANYFPSLDPDTAKKLDEVIDAGMMRVANSGPSVREAVVEHGVAAYKQEARQRLVAQHDQTCNAMDGMIEETINGKQVSGMQITRCAAGFLANLIEDRDASMGLSQEISNDNALADHSLKMALLAMAIGIEKELDADNIRKLGITALVQDWGLTLVPREIRDCPTPWDDSQFMEIQKHPIHTVNMLQRVLGLPDVTLLVAYQVHERPDGSGYPRGRDEKTIHLFARILRVADEYLMLTTGRPGRRPMMPYAAMECLLRMAGQKRVDRDVVRALLNVQSLFPIGSYVALSDGSVAQVMRRNSGDYTRPFVRRVTDSEGTPLPADDAAPFIDLSGAGLSIVQAIPTPGRDETTFTADTLEWRS